MKTAALYIRVSTHNQEELSPDAQKRLLIDYAKSNDYIVSDEYIFIENGVSGRKAEKRPQFQKMIALAKSKDHPFDAILIWKFSRFARNQEESIVYKSLLHKNGVEVISISEPLVDGPFGSLIERIIEWMDEYYSIRLSGEVMKGMTENAMRGNWQASPPYGYAIAHKGATPNIVPEEAEVVRMIFNLYVTDMKSPFEIAKHLNSLGIVTKRGNQWENRTVRYIIQNPVYSGYTRWNMRDQTESTQRIKDQDEWIIAKGNFEPIISEELFQKAQDRWNSEYHPKNAKPFTHKKHWLSGIVKCSACGRSLSVSQSKDKRYGRTYINFQCYGYLKGKCTVSHQISEKRLVPAILDAIQHVLETGDINISLVNHINTSEKVDTRLIESQLEKVSQKEKRVKDAYINGIDTLEEYRLNKNRLSDERKRLLDELERVSDKVVPIDKKTYLKTVSDVYNILCDEESTWEDKYSALHTIISKITYHKATDSVELEFLCVKKP